MPHRCACGYLADVIAPPKRVLIGHKRLTGLDDAIRAARPDVELRAKDHDTITADDLAWAEVYVGFRRPKPIDLGGVRWIHCVGAGVDAFVAGTPVAAHIMITRTSEDFGPQIAEYCVARALAFTQSLMSLAVAQRERRWEPDHLEPLAGSRVVIVGTGTVGRRIAHAFTALGCIVDGVSRSGAAVAPFRRVVRSGQLGEAVAGAHWLVLAAPHTPDTVHLVDRAVLERCRGTVLINVGRGALVDESVLPEALYHKWLRGAALDVFEQEPLPPESPLWGRDNVMISPHISGITTVAGAAAGFLECLAAVDRGETPPWLVDRARGY